MGLKGSAANFGALFVGNQNHYESKALIEIEEPQNGLPLGGMGKVVPCGEFARHPPSLASTILLTSDRTSGWRSNHSSPFRR